MSLRGAFFATKQSRLGGIASQKRLALTIKKRSVANRLGWYLLLVLFSLPALSPLVTQTPTRSADALLHLYRLVQLDALWQRGVFFSRWLPDLLYGYGLPLFNYYAPLVYYLTTPLHTLGLSFSLALNLSFIAALFVGTLGMFWFARSLLSALAGEARIVNAGALVAALAYLYSPYLLFNALDRGNLAEQWALAFAPLALWRLYSLAHKPNIWNWVFAVLTFAAVMLSHNVTSFLFAPLALCFALVCVYAGRRTTAGVDNRALGRAALSVLAAFLLGLGLSAFFWLPALLERDLVQIARVIVTPDFDYRFNFVSPAELVSLLPRADTGRLNPAYPSTLGIVQIALAAAGFAFLLIRAHTRRALPLFLLAIAGIVLTVMMLSLSQPLWDNLSLLSFVQLPMRLRGLVALCLAPLAGAAIFWFSSRWIAASTAVAIAALVLSAFPMLYPRYAPDVPANPTLTDMFAYEQRTGVVGTTSFGEYLPVWVQNPPDSSPFSEFAANRPPDRFVLPEGVTSCGYATEAVGQSKCIQTGKEWRAVYRALYFPGWRAYADGKPLELEPTPRTGLFSFSVPPARTVRVVYEGTAIERAADWISLVSAIVVLGVVGMGVVQARRKGRGASQEETQAESSGELPRSVFIPLLLVALGLIGFKLFYTDRVSSPLVAHFDGAHIEGISQPRDITFGSEMQLLGFDVSRSTVKRGELLKTVLYWRTLHPLTANLSAFVHLTAPDGFVLAQKDNLHPANLPTSQWETYAYAADEHTFELPATLAPGEYELRAGVYDPRTNTRLTTPDGADYILLGKITVAE